MRSRGIVAPLSHAEKFRRTHERWLNAALRGAAPIPRIPVRRADLGGFDDLLARSRGREVADRWWRRAFALTPDAR
jgi:hypothetical protein